MSIEYRARDSAHDRTWGYKTRGGGQSIPAEMSRRSSLTLRVLVVLSHVLLALLLPVAAPAGETCDGNNLYERTVVVDAACCDDPKCATGVPAVCSLECAKVALPFFQECANVLGRAADAFERLVVACEADQTDPCWGVDCGAHGTCVAGSCECTGGYSGERCEVAPVPLKPCCNVHAWPCRLCP